MKARPLARSVAARPTTDGAGVRLSRTIGTPALDHLDPFLLLDEFKSEEGADYVGGFPDHPHRGFETVTYMLAGLMRHRDHAGNEGVLKPGGAQWMTAGRGIVHSEMPEQEDGLLWGFQLWVNLPAEHKLSAPRYQDIAPDEIPEISLGGARVRVVAGEVAGQEGPVRGVVTRPLYLDVRLEEGERLEHPLPGEHSAFLYVYEGSVFVGGEEELNAGTLGVLGEGEVVSVTAGEEGGRLLLVAGKPTGEPVVRHGPFVMNTQEEIVQAVRDYQAGLMG